MKASEPSPWVEAPSDFVPTHWRDDPRWRNQIFAKPGNSGPVYAAGFGGTVLAGGLFPIAVLFFGEWAIGRGAVQAPGELFEFLAIGSIVGVLVAGVAAAPIFLIVGLVQALTGLSRWRATFAAIAGGWSGFAATLALFHRELMPRGLTLGLIAMAMGQIGAGVAAHAAERRQRATPRCEPVGSARYQLRQLFGLTASVAVLAALLAAMRLPGVVHASIALGVVFQALTFGLCRLLTNFFAEIDRRAG